MKKENGFETIYNEYFRRVYAFLSKMCPDPFLCEEMTQETFYQAFKSFHRYDGSCEMFTWLAAVAKNTYFKYLRKNRIHTVDIDLVPDGDGGEFDPARVIQKQMTGEAVKKAVSSLPTKYKDVVVLRIYAELSFADIGKSLDISENSAKVIFFRAKKMLKEALKDEYQL
ncbi:MAG: sigma-70 family RNA polymerase sigma factor [Clostridia bacterium]|nr:sigma-70 family RNA polymerase sigma factor [Clostridia bacterium]